MAPLFVLKAVFEFLEQKEAYDYEIDSYYRFANVTLRYSDVHTTYHFNFNAATKEVSNYVVDSKQII